MKRSLLIFLLLLLTSAKKTTEGNLLVWSEIRPLRWDDFRGKPPRRHQVAGATTVSGIRFEYASTGDTAVMHVVAVFDKTRSWARKDVVTEEALVHEQKHFDITEWYARQLRAALHLGPGDYAKPASYAKEEYKNAVAACLQTQKRYDRETDYSRISVKQQEWNKLIADTLKALAGEADTVITWTKQP